MGSTTVAYSPLGSQIDKASELADGIITESKLAAGAVTVNKLGTNAVETAKIKDANVTTAKLLGFVNLEFVGSSTGGSIADSVTETTLATITIAAGTVTTAILIYVGIRFKNTVSSAITATYRIKTGATGSEVERDSIPLIVDTGGGDGADINGGSLLFYDTNPNWAVENTVLITAENSSGNAAIEAFVDQVIVTGH